MITNIPTTKNKLNVGMGSKWWDLEWGQHHYHDTT